MFLLSWGGGGDAGAVSLTAIDREKVEEMRRDALVVRNAVIFLLLTYNIAVVFVKAGSSCCFFAPLTCSFMSTLALSLTPPSYDYGHA